MKDAALLMVANQVTLILKFFLSKNLRIARERAWDQTVRSRGKGPEFWQPYVEEWAIPPTVKSFQWSRLIGSPFGRLVILRGLYCVISTQLSRILIFFNLFVGILLPLNFYPFIGIAIAAFLKSVGTARYLHKPVRISFAVNQISLVG